MAFEEPNLYEKFTANENLNYFSTFYEKEFLPRPWLAEKLSLNDAMDQTVGTYSKRHAYPAKPYAGPYS